MNVIEKPELTQLIVKLWGDFFPHKNTPAADIARVSANKDWIKDSLMFYGWQPEDQRLDINIRFVDGGALLYRNEDICAVISIDWSGGEPKLRFTYVDNRPL